MLMAVTNRTTTTLEIINVLFERDFSCKPCLADMGEQRYKLHNEIIINLI